MPTEHCDKRNDLQISGSTRSHWRFSQNSPEYDGKHSHVHENILKKALFEQLFDFISQLTASTLVFEHIKKIHKLENSINFCIFLTNMTKLNARPVFISFKYTLFNINICFICV